MGNVVPIGNGRVPAVTDAVRSADRTDAHPAFDPLTHLDLDLTADGDPGRPLIVIELDGLRHASSERIASTLAAMHDALPVVVGVFRKPPTESLAPLLSATTLNLTNLPVSRLLPQAISVEDIDIALGQLRAVVTRSPRAAVACAQLLRQTVHLDPTRALAAEAAVYSMLLSGPEFARWLAERGPAREIRWPDRDLVRLDRNGHRLSIVLDHPERRNALSARMREELLTAVQVAEADSAITDIEISGAGTIFCSGGDLDEFGTAIDPVSAYLVRLDRAPWRVMDRLAAHLTVRAQGACVGAGLELAAFAGSLVATRDTYFTLPEVRMGLVPGAGGTLSIPRRIGRWRAAWLMLTGQRLSAPTALRWGLIDRIADEAS